MHSLPYFYRQPLYRLGSGKASVSFVNILPSFLSLLHVFYKTGAGPASQRAPGGGVFCLGGRWQGPPAPVGVLFCLVQSANSGVDR